MHVTSPVTELSSTAAAWCWWCLCDQLEAVPLSYLLLQQLCHELMLLHNALAGKLIGHNLNTAVGSDRGRVDVQQAERKRHTWELSCQGRACVMREGAGERELAAADRDINGCCRGLVKTL